MNMRSFIITACFSLSLASLYGQNNSRDVLFSIDDRPYFTDDFKRVYTKNLDLIPEAERDLDTYLTMYVDYKLKVAQARALGLDTTATLKRELNENRNQLTAKYLTDERITETLIMEAYERSLVEVNASHILFLVAGNALPQDTLKAYDKAMKVRNEILSGASFSKVAAKYSDDPSAVENGGDLGYFSVFKMVYPFESGAYQTAVDGVSLPVRSEFGYHLIKVNDKRETRGDLSIANLLLLKPENGDVEAEKAVEKKIFDLYNRLKKGADFTALVREYSEDLITRENGGELQKFSSGALRNPVLEDAAYALEFPGAFSYPIETDYGWVILRLIQKYPLPKYEEVKDMLTIRVKRDSRSRVVNETLLEQLKTRFKLDVNKKAVASLKSYLSEAVYENAWKEPQLKKDVLLFTINNEKEVYLSEYLGFLQGNQLQVRNAKNLEHAAKIAYDAFVDSEYKNYYVDNLEKLNPEFEAIVLEYEEGMLLFDLMKQEVWEKVKEDTAGYTRYYELHKNDYIVPKTAKALIFEIPNDKVAKKVVKLLSKGKTKEEIKNAFSFKETNSWKIREVLIEENDAEWGKEEAFGLGVYLTNTTNNSKIIQIQHIDYGNQEGLEYFYNQVLSDYQDAYEKEWIDNLRANAKITIDKAVLRKLENELNDEK